MARYLFHGSYNAEGLRGVMKEGGSARRTAIISAAESVGGSLESFYFAFGKDSFYIVCELPSNEAAAAISIAATAAGTASVTTAVLLTPEDVDRAIKLAPAYRAPGQ